MKFGRVVLVGSLLSSLFVAPPGRADGPPTGRILVPTATVSRAHRCATTTDAQNAQGVFGWTLAVTPGAGFALRAADTSGIQDFDIFFYPSLQACEQNAVPSAGPHANRSGDEEGVVPADSTVALVTLHSGTAGAEFFYTELPAPPPPADPPGTRAFTVVGVVDGGFSPYHFDFLGHQHSWNLDSDLTNNFDAYADPATYITGYPGSTPINITIPTSTTQEVGGLRSGADAGEWAKLQASTATNVKMYRFPGTKIIGALNFTTSSQFYGTNSSHGTRSAASAAGNVHGTCPECLFVLINGTTTAALAWAASQPWIDVVTNSYGHSIVGGFVRDNVYFGAPLDATRSASNAGQFIVFSAGNGLVNAFDVPMFTYWSSEKGPDWIITVGAADPRAQQQYSGAGKPVDISSIGSSYPSTGGTTANGAGTHSGTSNAAPVTAGTFARVIQQGRAALGDATEGYAGGVVASGGAFACGSAYAACPLADGVLTRAEVQEVVFRSVLPSPFGVALDTVWPSTAYNYYYQGHGVITGRSQNPPQFKAEQRRFVDVLRGSAAPYARPAGETNWFVVDSKCRQKLWGAWTGGYYQGSDPVLNSQADPIATAFNEWCSRTPNEAFYGLSALLYG